MDFQRLILVAALSFTLLIMWQAWQEDYGQPQTENQAAATVDGTSAESAVRKDMPSAPLSSDGSTPADAPPVAQAKRAERIHVTTDLYDIELDTTGGDLRRVDLLAYPVSVDQPDKPFRLMDDESEFHIAQAALLAAGDSPAPNHHQLFNAEKSEYRMAEGAESLEVRLSWSDESGVRVDKIYTFHRGSYTIDVDFEVYNQSGQQWNGHLYRQLQRGEPADSGSMFIYTYTGGVIYSEEEKYEKIKFDDMRKETLSRNIEGGWAAMIQHYFLSAWVPQPDEAANYYSKAPGGNRYILGMVSPAMSVAPGESQSISSRLYVGPKLQDQLEEVAKGLELTVDYGFLTVIAKPLFWMLELIHSFVGNWGWSIILITIMIKAAFYKLSETSYKSMAQMRKLQPRLKQLKERFGDDKQKLNEAMMKMYREEKINPLGGCLPILVQIPVFIALYWMLLESVEMRQAPFMFWIQDLSIKDPYFVLPVLMGITMFIQHRLNPTPLDPIQARVMMILPIAFTFFFMFFPAGLVLYWVVNNTLSIAQQYYITRVVIGDK
ncbi:MAG: membrane protein insertase YidC [Gammaproteobacteria bacterium]|nr:membrane protein insertase YidC [Gammaproteobacteria bacterium]